jgi:mannose-6-phosphate isomerase-like protein (cupin superfamily)
MSLNVVPPGKGIPFLHRHQENDEIYVVVGGRGQFLVDGECIDVEEGSVLRISPPAARAWRNNSDAPLYFLCIQYRADSVIQGGTFDGRKAEGTPAWPN